MNWGLIIRLGYEQVAKADCEYPIDYFIRDIALEILWKFYDMKIDVTVRR